MSSKYFIGFVISQIFRNFSEFLNAYRIFKCLYKFFVVSKPYQVHPIFVLTKKDKTAFKTTPNQVMEVI
jgi:hypothetical protein